MTTSSDTHRGGWYHGWNIVAVCILSGIAANALPINAYSLFLKNWSADLHEPISTLQLGIAAIGLSSAFLAPLVGSWADKYPSRLLFGIGLAGVVLFCVGISLMHAVWQYFLLYLLLLPLPLGLTTSLTANAVVSRWFKRRLGLALGLTAFGLGLGGVIVPPLAAGLMHLLGWRGIFQAAAALIGFVILPLALLVLRDRPAERDGQSYLISDSGDAAPHAVDVGETKLRLRDVFARRTFWLLVIVYLPMLALYGGCQQNIGPMAASRGLDQQTAAFLLSLLSLSQLAASLAGGMLSDRFGSRLSLAGFSFATAIGGAVVAFSQHLLPMEIGVVLAGIGGGFWPLLVTAIAVEFGAGAVGRVFGLVVFFLPAAVFSPFLVAKVQESTGSYAPVLIALAVLCCVAGTAYALFLRERTSPA
jgi:MFS family permease